MLPKLRIILIGIKLLKLGIYRWGFTVDHGIKKCVVDYSKEQGKNPGDVDSNLNLFHVIG